MGIRRALGSFAALLACATLAGPTPAGADGAASIDHVEVTDGRLQVLFSIPEVGAGSPIDLSTTTVTFNGTDIPARARLAADAAETEAVRRTAVLALDVSKSMQGARFAEAKQAAQAYITNVPKDVYVGLLTFAGDVRVVQEPTLDRPVLSAALQGLELSLQTRLYEGLRGAVAATGTDGQRSVLLLSDGKDTSRTSLEAVTQEVADSGIKLDVVALQQSGPTLEALTNLAVAGAGQVIPADDPEALTSVFSDEASALARQILVTAPLPAELTGEEGSLSVSVAAGSARFSDSAFSTLGSASPSDVLDAGQPLEAPAPGMLASPNTLLIGLGASGVAALILLLAAFGVVGQRKSSVEETIDLYTRNGSHRAATRSGPVGGGKSVAGSAVGVAERALSANRNFESVLGDKLDAAGLSLKPAEWLLLHSGIGIGAAMTAFLLSSGNILLALIGLFVGGVLPWLYLSRKKDKRLKAFNSQLAETLQLISGSLSAGLSLAQSLDTVVREGADPVAGEFRRALVEARLGVQIEDALDQVAKRMDSPDFAWVVMAIRIQRDVGGNLAELLLNVAATLRERDYLRRQVKTLSAEGRMSAWILTGLPPALLLYMTVVNPSYLEPMITTPLGWALLGLMVFLLAIGGFWMSRLVKVEV